MHHTLSTTQPPSHHGTFILRKPARENPPPPPSGPGAPALRRYFWPVPPDVTPRGIVVLAHGHGCYLAFDYLRPQVGPAHGHVSCRARELGPGSRDWGGKREKDVGPE